MMGIENKIIHLTGKWPCGVCDEVIKKIRPYTIVDRSSTELGMVPIGEIAAIVSSTCAVVMVVLTILKLSMEKKDRSAIIREANSRLLASGNLSITISGLDISAHNKRTKLYIETTAHSTMSSFTFTVIQRDEEGNEIDISLK